MNLGYVYILTNPSMPGLVKIGRTSRDVGLRAAELWQTGVPTKFEVYASEKTSDCVQLEAYVHGDLRKRRLSKSREFFQVDPGYAHERLRFWVEYQAETAAREFLDEHFGAAMAVVPYREYVSGIALERLASASGKDLRAVICAIELLTVEEILPAISRAEVQHRQEQIEAFQQIGIPKEEWEGLLNG